MHAEPFFDALSGIKGKSLRAVGSAPTGQRALLVAINYSSTPWAKTPQRLIQPQHDVQLMKEYLLKYTGFSQSDITVLTDTEGTPKHRLPTYINILREIKRLGTSNCQNMFFLYTGRSDRRPLPKQSTQERGGPTSAPGQQAQERFDQFIIPLDAVVGPELEDIDPNLLILAGVLHKHLIATRPARSTFLAILDTSHAGTLFNLKHHRCNRTRSLKSLLRRSVRKVVVEPLWGIIGKTTDGILANADSFNASDSCNGLCPRGKKTNCPIAVTISAGKDQQHVQTYENGRSLTETIVELMRSEPTAGLPDVIDSVLMNYKLQQKLMKHMEKLYKKAGDTAKMQEMQETRLHASQLMPEVASTVALDLSDPQTWSGLALRNDR